MNKTNDSKSEKLFIHVHGPTLRNNRAFSVYDPVVVIKRAADVTKAYFVREAIINGSSRIVHRPASEALPGSDERTVCWVETDSPVLVKIDDHPQLMSLAEAEVHGLKAKSAKQYGC